MKDRVIWVIDDLPLTLSCALSVFQVLEPQFPCKAPCSYLLKTIVDAAPCPFWKATKTLLLPLVLTRSTLPTKKRVREYRTHLVFVLIKKPHKCLNLCLANNRQWVNSGWMINLRLRDFWSKAFHASPYPGICLLSLWDAVITHVLCTRVHISGCRSAVMSCPDSLMIAEPFPIGMGQILHLPEVMYLLKR